MTPEQTRNRALADFRFTLRKFLRFSEEAATRAGLTPQQHQLLLQIAGAPEETPTVVGYLAERLALCHHTVVELCNRSERAGLIRRVPGQQDRRAVILELTREGRQILHRLSRDHARELNELGPQLIQTLQQLTPA